MGRYCALTRHQRHPGKTSTVLGVELAHPVTRRTGRKDVTEARSCPATVLAVAFAEQAGMVAGRGHDRRRA